MLKEMVVGSAIGRAFASMRNAGELVVAGWSKPEILGTVANDQLATHLIAGMNVPGKTFVDVGAHIGSVVAAVQHAEPSVKIIAVEAVPEKARRLQVKFPNVEVHQCAVGDQEGEAWFFVDVERSGYSSLGQPGTSGSAFQKIRVPIHKLDTLIAASDIEAIKIDVEGAELGVLRGAEELIHRNRPVVMFESGPETPGELGFTKEALWQFFADSSYSVHVPNRMAHADGGLSQEGFIESHYYPRRTTNYFAVPVERREEYKSRARRVFGIGTA